MFLPSLRQLQYLIALNDEKSFSKAATICHVTQSTLSAGIKELENILGQPVIDRSKRKVILTPLGLEMVHQSEMILERAQKMMNRAKSFEEPMSGPLRLGVIPTIAPYLLPDILPRIQKQFPRLELQIYEDMSERLIDSLNKGDIDLALMAFPYDTPNLSQKILFDEEFCLGVPKARIFENENITASDLDPGELLLLEDGHCLSDHALSACDIQLPKRRKAYSASSLPTLMQMVVSGYGITLIPDMAIAARAVPKGIKLIRFKHPPPLRQIGLCWRTGSPRIEDFMTLGKIIGTTPAPDEI